MPFPALIAAPIATLVNYFRQDMIERQRQEHQASLEIFRHENQVASQMRQFEFSAWESEKSRALQADLAQFNQDFQRSENDKNRVLQVYLAQTNAQAVAIQGQLNREFQEKLQRLNLDFQKNENQLNRNHALQLAEFHAQLQVYMFERQKESQLSMKEMDMKYALQLRQEDRKHALEMLRQNRQAQKLPICLCAEDILSGKHHEEEVFLMISPFSLQFDVPNASSSSLPTMEKGLEHGLRQLCELYKANGQSVSFKGGVWDTKVKRAEAAMQFVFNELRSESVIVLESSLEGEKFHLNLACWSKISPTFRYQTVLNLAWRDILINLTKIRTAEQIEAYKGIDENELKLFLGDKPFLNYKHNSMILRLAERMKNIQTTNYFSASEDFAAFEKWLVAYHNLVAGIYIDEHFLLNVAPSVRKRPLLPKLLKEMAKTLPEGFLDYVAPLLVTTYEMFYQILEKEEPHWAAELRLDLAHTLAHLSDKSFAKKYIIASLEAKTKQNL